MSEPASKLPLLPPLRRRGGARAVRAFVWLAAATPFLAHELPIVHRDASGLRFPLLLGLGFEDLFWLAVVAGDLAWRWRRRARVVSALPLVAWALLALASTGRPPAASGDLRDRELAAGEWIVRTPVGWGATTSDWRLATTPGAELPAPASRDHWLGTDAQGRDFAARLLHGARVSLGVGVAATAIALGLGLAIGLACGTARGVVDVVLMRATEVMLCFPHLFLVLIVFAYLPHSRTTLILLLGLVGWTTTARLARGELLRLQEQEFVAAARALGASRARLALRHLLPNALAPILVAATFAVAGAMLAEFTLSWLGFGVAPPTPSLGQMLADGQPLLERAPFLSIAPGLLIFVVVLSFNALAEELREATTPERRRVLPARPSSGAAAGASAAATAAAGAPR